MNVALRNEIVFPVSVYLYLFVFKFAVLQVDRGGDSAHTCVGVVVGVLAHTVGETLLKERTDARKRRRATHF